MFYNRGQVYQNICILDSHDMNITSCEGDRCFVIGHHVGGRSVLTRTADLLIQGGFSYFNLFGTYAPLWKNIIRTRAEGKRPVRIEASTVDREGMVYTLAMFAALEPQAQNFVLSDDAFFTEYLVEDLEEIFSGKSPYTPRDWQIFRSGFEFTYHGKDAVMSVGDGIVTGFLKEEKKFHMVFEAFSAPIFDGKSFDEIWDEIANQRP